MAESVPLKVYQIIFSYLEPAQAAARIRAESEEEAIRILNEQLSQQVLDFHIEAITELSESIAPPPEQDFDPLPDNVIPFVHPTHKTTQ